MLVFMVLRTAFMFRALMTFNKYNSAFSKKLFRSYGYEPSPMFTVKALLSTKPEKTCIILFISTSLVFSYWVRIFELPYQRAAGCPQFDNFRKAIWFTIVTLFTIGYGDYYPFTDPGKFISIVLAFWGAVLLALVVVSISNIFAIDGKKKVALTHLHTTNQAAKAIQAGMKYFISKKKLHMLQYKKGDIDLEHGFLKGM